jgi:hypothetical protein
MTVMGRKYRIHGKELECIKILKVKSVTLIPLGTHRSGMGRY